MNLRAFLRAFTPHRTQTSLAEKLRSGLAGGLSILLLAFALHFLPQHEYPLLLLGSMAASAVLLFAVPHSPLAQPWNLIGGHFVSALTGWTVCLLIPHTQLAAGIAVGASIFLMYLLHCLHPPGAATALTLVLGAAQFQQMGWRWVALIVIANTGLSLLLALLINSLLPQRRYPALAAVPPAPPAPVTVTPELQDIEWALEQMDSAVDISTDDLLEIYNQSLQHAKARYESALE